MQVVKWGLIGCGDIVQKRVAPAIRELESCRLVTVCRSQAAKAEQCARAIGAERSCSDWRELIADPEIDAVYVATPVDLHAEQTIEAARRGKHVLCEKPMALSVEQCDEMIRVCREADVRLGVAYYRHFYPVVRRLRNLLDEGVVGKPVIVQVNAFEWLDLPKDHPRHWFLEKERSGGGPMFDFGCHRIGVLLDLFGQLDRVQARLGTLVFEREVEDTAVALFEFSGGPLAVLSVTHAAREPQDTLAVFGSEGSLHVPDLNAGVLSLRTPGGEKEERHPPHSNVHLPLIEDFTRALMENREPAVAGEYGREIAHIEAAVYSQEML